MLWVDKVMKMSDVHAEHAPGALMDPMDQRGALGAHVVAAKWACAAFAWEGVCGPVVHHSGAFSMQPTPV